MFRFYKVVRRFFSLGATDKVLLFHLFFSSTMRTLSVLILPYVASRIVDFATEQDWQRAFLEVGIFALSAIVCVAMDYYNHWAYARNAGYIHRALQQKILEKVVTLPTNFNEDIPSAAIINVAFKNVDKCRTFPDNLFDCAVNIVGIIAAAVILIFVEPTIGIISAISIALCSLLYLYHMRRRDFFNAIQAEREDDVADLYSQTIDGRREIHSFNMREDLSEYSERAISLWKKANLKKRFHQDLADTIVPFINGITRIMVYLISADAILNGNASIATLVLIIGYYDDIMNNYGKVTDKITELSKSIISINRMHRFLNYKTPNMQKFGEDSTDDIRGKVEFKNVSFSYSRKISMKDLNFVIKPHTFTAIVGKSGSGKSTIFRLLLRLYKPKRGKIFIDNKNIEDYTKDVYATNVSIVTQKPFIFDATIRENLNLVDDNVENQIKACKTVGIHNDIMRLPKGYNTPLINDGGNLSAGQRQLLSLARTLLSKSEILLFDEVTSSLNDEASAEVVKVLQKLKKDHTVIMITHKPELMRLADDILVIDKGRIVARGDHKKLMEKSSIYKSLQM